MPPRPRKRPVRRRAGFTEKTTRAPLRIENIVMPTKRKVHHEIIEGPSTISRRVGKADSPNNWMKKKVK